MAEVTEHQLYEQIARYLQLQYHDVIYRFDLASDLKLTMGQASKHKRLHPRRGYPDLFIAEPAPRCIDGSWDYEWYGLYIEIKRDGESPLKKDGTLKAGQHIKEQHEMLVELERKGYRAVFGVGFDQCKQIIDDYLKLRN